MRNKPPKDFTAVRRPPAGFRARKITEAQRLMLNKKKAVRVGGEPASEAEHFMKCPGCGQYFDMRNLGDAFYHDEEGHAPLPVQPVEQWEQS